MNTQGENDMNTQVSYGLTVKQVVTRSFEGSVAKGWYEEERSFGDIVALIHSEVSEALEAFRDGDTKPRLREDGKPEGVPSELADIVIRVADYCGHANIDLDAAIRSKLQYNQTRPHRHGGKAL